MSDANRRSTISRSGPVVILAGVAMLVACQRQSVEPGLPPTPAATDSAAVGAEAAPSALTLIPLFGTDVRYIGTTTARAYVTAADQPAQATDSIETVVWFRLNNQSIRAPGTTSRLVLHLDSARTVTRGRSRLPQQQDMHDAASYELISEGARTTILPGEVGECTIGSLASMVALQLPLPMFSSARAWSDSLRFDGCTSMIRTRGQAAVDYLPVAESPLMVRRSFTLSSKGAGMMDSVSVQLSTTSRGDGRIALQLDSLGRVLLLSLADSITTELEFASEFGTQRFLQTVLRTTEVVAAAGASQP